MVPPEFPPGIPSCITLTSSSKNSSRDSTHDFPQISFRNSCRDFSKNSSWDSLRKKYKKFFLDSSRNLSGRLHALLLGYFQEFLPSQDSSRIQDLHGISPRIPSYPKGRIQAYLPRFLHKFLPGFVKEFHPGISPGISAGIQIQNAKARRIRWTCMVKPRGRAISVTDRDEHFPQEFFFVSVV